MNVLEQPATESTRTTIGSTPRVCRSSKAWRSIAPRSRPPTGRASAQAAPRCTSTGAATSATCSCYEIPPGKSTIPQRHLFEEMFYVLEGAGSTQLELPTASGAASNGERAACSRSRSTRSTGTSTAAASQRALLVSTTNLPMMLNLFHNERFVFDNDFDFDDRIGKKEYFAGEGVLAHGPPGQRYLGDQLRPRPGRGSSCPISPIAVPAAAASYSCWPTARCTRTSRRCRPAPTRRRTATAPAIM